MGHRKPIRSEIGLGFVGSPATSLAWEIFSPRQVPRQFGTPRCRECAKWPERPGMQAATIFACHSVRVRSLAGEIEVPGTGFEPVRSCDLGILSPLCLPVSPPGQSRIVAESTGGGGRNRTGVHGFAGRCMTTLPPRPGARSKKGRTPKGSPSWNLERERSLELPTSTLARLRSTN